MLAPPLQSTIDTGSERFRQNRDDALEQVQVIDELLAQAEAGGGPTAIARMRSRGKMPIRERIANVLDPDTPFLEISALAGYGSSYTIGGGMVIGIGIIAGTECVIMGNDPSVLGGALTPYSGKKWSRAIEIARDNRIPYVSFVESAGADLRMGGAGNEGPMTQTTHFAESGRPFYEMIELSKLGIPSVCVVFGSSTAGGAYQPGLSDYVIVVKEQSKIFLAGPPLVKMATGEDSDDETLGGATLHAETSGLGDYFADDEMDALRLCREVVSHLNRQKPGPLAASVVDEPVHDSEELLGLVSRDLRQPVDVRDVIGRVVDGSRFEEFKQRWGPTMVCGWASIHGYPVGILGNNGVIYPDASQKAAHFIQLCNQIDVPLVFLQNVTGYMVGRDFEADGIVKKGSQMINAVTNSTVPHLTVIIGSSYGAGTYGMSGRAFGNRFTFIWPTAKIAVMGPKQIAGVMSIVRRTQAARKGIEFDEEEDTAIVAMVEAAQEKSSLALAATGAISDDGIIDPRDTRTILGLCLSVVRNRPIEGAETYGVFRL
ncbi:MAG: acyl-CoA carboxylase subunit beta [Ilumatobacteraceae bacterium]|jgi:acetyl-CoA carboxylase carboxyltransferase component|nr:acyl-CoA carboxylase subunit beta [Actinomycetota bacterium]MBK8334424.1 acyl-CoA carboxylase subunit beta [Acidimicrobiaceae bacterium]MBP8209963.1 acyl-CoA carboxylase subunit beta [Ilumatobacteraceae bacterium]MBP9051237.1 acyl-CoA carboxylase subunit beta [Ilumatobacteraceae bacterium]